MLYALEIPKLFGLPLGDTEFASAAAAWDALPEPLRQQIEGRRAVFDFTGRKRAFPPTQAEIQRYPPVRHPSSEPTRSPDASASTSCAMIASISTVWSERKPRHSSLR